MCANRLLVLPPEWVPEPILTQRDLAIVFRNETHFLKVVHGLVGLLSVGVHGHLLGVEVRVELLQHLRLPELNVRQKRLK